nr:TonB-dependent receptor plug domain-containing protein [Mucilaginibacter sp. L294]
MQNSSRDLNEVVFVGYGTTRKSDVTGSVGSLKGSDLNRPPSGSIDQLLQGKIAGVQVIAPSGQPGAGATIRVRALGSRSGANALVVIDGIPLGDAGNITQVNPDDIESIEVLKDASSASHMARVVQTELSSSPQGGIKQGRLVSL